MIECEELSYTQNMKYEDRVISISRVIRDALSFNPENWGKKKFDASSIPSAVKELFTLLAERKVNYVLVGGIALLSYVESRNTSDLDLIIGDSSLRQVPEIEVSSKEPYFGRGAFRGLQLNFLFTDQPIFKLVGESYSTVRKFEEHEIVTATVEGLVLMKLFALPSLYRQGDFVRVGLYENDIAVLVNEYQPDETGILRTLKEYLEPSDMAEIEGILNELHGRINRFVSKQ